MYYTINHIMSIIFLQEPHMIAGPVGGPSSATQALTIHRSSAHPVLRWSTPLFMASFSFRAPFDWLPSGARRRSDFSPPEEPYFLRTRWRDRDGRTGRHAPAIMVHKEAAHRASCENDRPRDMLPRGQAAKFSEDCRSTEFGSSRSRG